MLELCTKEPALKKESFETTVATWRGNKPQVTYNMKKVQQKNILSRVSSTFNNVHVEMKLTNLDKCVYNVKDYII